MASVHVDSWGSSRIRISPRERRCGDREGEGEENEVTDAELDEGVGAARLRQSLLEVNEHCDARGRHDRPTGEHRRVRP